MEMQVEIDENEQLKKAICLQGWLIFFNLFVWGLAFWIKSEGFQILLGAEGMQRIQGLESVKGVPSMAAIWCIGCILILALRPRHASSVLALWAVSNAAFALFILTTPEMGADSQQGYQVLKLISLQIAFCSSNLIVFFASVFMVRPDAEA